MSPPTISWTGAGDGTSWEDPNNWDDGVPQAGDDVLINQDGASVIYQNTTDVTGLASVTVDNATLTQDLDTVSTDTLSTDPLSTGSLSVGTAPPSTDNPSSYNLESGTLVATDGIAIGENGGEGTINQTGGLITIGVWYDGQILADGQSYAANAGLLTIGAAGGVGYYYLGQTGQLLTASWSGYPGGTSPPPSFDNTNDAPYLQIFGNTVIGEDFGSTGTFALAGDGSSLSENFVAATANPNTGLGGNLVVGSGGAGTFTQTDDTSVYLDGGLAIGLNSGSVGQYTLTAGDSTTGGGSLSVGADLTIGGGITSGSDVSTETAPTGGTGTFEQDSGTVQTYGGVSIGLNGGTGTYTLTDGILNANGGLSAGTNGGTGTYTQTGGTATIGIASSASTLSLGVGPFSGSVGTLNLSTTNTSNPGLLTVYGSIDDGQDTDTTGNVIIGTPGAAGDPTNLSVDTDANGDGGNMTVGDAGNGYLTVYSGTLDVQNNINIGVNGSGTVTQYDGSTVTAGFVDLSLAAGSGTSSYTVDGGVLGVGDLNIGGSSTGPALFTQIGGIVNVQDDNGGLSVNNNKGGGSSYVMTAGALNVFNTLQIGAGGLSTFTQSGGTTTLGSDTTGSNVALDGVAALEVGQGLGDDGQYTFGTSDTTPVLNVDGAGIIGDSGIGNFNQESGTATFSSSLTIGNGGSGNGSYTLSGGTLAVDDGSINVGAGGAGTFAQTGGLVNALAGEIIGNNGATTASYTQTGGTANVYAAAGANNALVVGAGADSGTDATYTLSSSSQSAAAHLIVEQGGLLGGVDIGADPGTTGNFIIGTEGLATDATSMTLEGPNPIMTVGDFGTGNLTIYSGSLDIETYLNIGVNGAGTVMQDGGTLDAGNVEMSSYVGDGTSSYTISAGTLFANDLNVGPPMPSSSTAGTATFKQEGSSNVELEDLNIDHFADGSTSQYTLSGGTLTAAYENIGSSGVGTFSQSGGNNALYQTLTIGAGGEYDFSGGALSAQNIIDSGTLVASGTDTIDSNISGSGAGELELDSGVALTVDNSISSTDIEFETGAEELSVANQSGTLGTISGFASGDTINLLNQNFTSADHVNYSDGLLTITDASATVLAKLDFAGSYTPSEFQANGTAITICFYPGTKISTASGQAAVETLSIDDVVTTHDGIVKPIRWIGRQTVSRVFADPLRVLPIRIKCGALGDNIPCRDLLVSPDHALLVDGVLIQAAALVNGISIAREVDVPPTFIYYHLELDDHSLVLAENTPAETFIDNIDRAAFDNWHEYEALYPEGKAIVEMPYPRAKALRQVPRQIRERLAGRGVRLFGASLRTVA